jgi:Protein of unknown function, DUF481
MSDTNGSRRTVLARRAAAVAALCLLLPAAPASAADVDTLRLNNGGQLACEIKKLQQGKLSISADPLGKASVHWGEVAGIASPREFEVTLESGDRYYGTLAMTPSAGGLIVTPFLEPPVTLRLIEVTALVPIGSSIWRRMDGNIDVGFSLAQANLETHWTLNGASTYRSRRYRVSSSIASQLTAREDADTTSRNTVSLNGSRLFDGQWFVTALVQLQQNEELALHLRTVGGGGVGKALWHSNHHTVDLFGGLVYTREDFTGEPVNNLAEIAAGGQLDFFTPGKEDFSLTNSVVSYYSAGRARIELQSAWRHEFLSDFYWSLNGVESFDSDPPDAQKKNDYSLSLSIGWKF